MRDASPARPVRLADYQPPAFLVDEAEFAFSLDPTRTRVTGRLAMRRNPARHDPPVDCVLDGEQLVLESVAIDDETLGPDRYRQEKDGSLVLKAVPARFVLETTVVIRPDANTALEGLYQSGGMLTTQCEAQGFRRITFFPDRPDVLTRFTTTLHADRERYPVLLSNGNPVARGEDEQGGHWVRWEDPFPKPCYLFALVAGDLAVREDTFTTCSGRDVALRLYAAEQDLDKLGHAMDSLKRAMAWDEQRYGREYDLDHFMVVAVSHFNMGAMENKGLNIFNTSCVLAHPRTTTDAGFQRVESVVAHEYFHNWSGNRVTCRDWFQLSLKEGLTVFRDQQFSEQMNSASVNRVENVKMLRTMQFPEDQGPMAHPVRPDEYRKIDNFYTLTVYEKGAELVRMQYNLLGPGAFRAATDLYFSRFDGQAVTCDDFVDCMEEASGKDLSVFRRWYGQAGTPRLHARDHYENGSWTLTLSQSTPPTPGQSEKKPVMIPVRLGLLDSRGEAMEVGEQEGTETVLVLEDDEQVFTFPVPEEPVPSLLRGFSAPVELDYDYSPQQLALLLAHDEDGYCRWDAARRLFFRSLDALIAGEKTLEEQVAALGPPLRGVIARADEDPAEAALLLELPGEGAIGDSMDEIRVDAIHDARQGLQRALGQALAEQWWSLVASMETPRPWQPRPEDMGRRSLRHRALEYLAAADDSDIPAFLQREFSQADNMTDQLGALRLLVTCALDGSGEALGRFREQWRDEPLVLDQWFAVQASGPRPETVEQIEALLDHPDFDWTLPNRVRAVLGTFAGANPVAFHREDGAGYRLFTDALARLDAINPQISARLAGPCSRLPRLPLARREQLRESLDKLDGTDCSDNLREVLGRILNNVG